MQKDSPLQRALVAMFIVGPILCAIGIVIGARAGNVWMRNLHAHRVGGSAESIARLCLVLIILGAAIFLVAVVLGLVAAFAPSVFGKPRSGRVRVAARFFLQEDGTPNMGDIPSDVAAKRCLRLVFDDGYTDDSRCDEFVYEQAPEGTQGVAEVKGNRLLSFRPAAPAQVNRGGYYDPLG